MHTLYVPVCQEFFEAKWVNNEILHSTFYTLEREIDWRVK